MNETCFVKGLTILKEAFPNRTLNAKVYFEALKDLDDEAFLGAITLLVQTTAKLYPDDNLIAMIREKVVGTVDDRAQLAWSTARNAIISIGMYRTVSFRDRVINGAIEAMGGWEKFCNMLVEEEPFRKKDFIALYEAIARTGRDCPEMLAGYFQKVNGIPEEIRFVGEVRKPKELTA